MTIEERLDRMESRLEDIITILTQKLPKAQLRALQGAGVSPSGAEEMKERILAKVTEVWDAMNVPIDMADLSRPFGKLAQPYGGVDKLIDQMPELATVMKLTGAKVVVIKSVYDLMPLEQREKLREFNLNEKTIERLKHRPLGNSLPLTPEEEARIQALTEESQRLVIESLGDKVL